MSQRRERAPSRGRYVYREGRGVIPIEEVYGEDYDKPKARIEINSDANFQMWHPMDKKVFTSKKRFRDHTRAYGCEEVGNEPVKPEVSYEPMPKGYWEDAVKETLEKYERGR